MANIGELSVGIKVDKASVAKMTKEIQSESLKAAKAVEAV